MGQPRGSEVVREEVFGPLLTIEAYDDIDDAITLANDSDYGLMANAWTRRSDLATAMAWESGMKSAVQVKGTLDDASDTDERWTTELQIPIANLNHVPHLPPTKGEVWRFNAYRLEHLVRLKQIEGQSFSPVLVGDFHNLPRFGRLVFE